MSRPRTYTLEEANEKLPSMTYHFDQIVRHRRQLMESGESYITIRDDIEKALRDLDDGGQTEFPNSSEVAKRCLQAIASEIRSIENGGVAIKNLDFGFVDIYGEIEGKVGFYCWQYGEREIMYWREPNLDFSERRPLIEGHESPLH